jgi:hypothetical protein
MGDGVTNLARIEIPSTDPIVLAVVSIYVLLGLACVVTNARNGPVIGFIIHSASLQ